MFNLCGVSSNYILGMDIIIVLARFDRIRKFDIGTY